MPWVVDGVLALCCAYSATPFLSKLADDIRKRWHIRMLLGFILFMTPLVWLWAALDPQENEDPIRFYVFAMLYAGPIFLWLWNPAMYAGLLVATWALGFGHLYIEYNNFCDGVVLKPKQQPPKPQKAAPEENNLASLEDNLLQRFDEQLDERTGKKKD